MFATEQAAVICSTTRTIMGAKGPDRRVQRTRQSLQDALVELIVEKGYEDITIQDVIDRANVGRSTFYTHFLDKEDLFLSEFEGLWRQLEQSLAGEDAGGDTIWNISRIMFHHV